MVTQPVPQALPLSPWTSYQPLCRPCSPPQAPTCPSQDWCLVLSLRTLPWGSWTKPGYFQLLSDGVPPPQRD